MAKHGPVLFLLIAALAHPMVAQVASQPLTEDEVNNLIKKNRKDPDTVFKALDARGVDFDLDREIEKKMRKAGADDAMLQAIWKAGPTAKNAKTALLTSAAGDPLQATYEEAMGFKTLQDEPDPDKRLRMAEEFATRFPNSALLSYVYTQAARACQQKGDTAKVLDYGEKSLKLDPGNLYSMLILAVSLAQPRQEEGSSDEATRRLTSADQYANRALNLIIAIKKPANEADDHFEKRKAALQADAHAALGMVEMQRDESQKAIDDFKTAISLSASPNPQYYFRLGEIYENNGKKADAIEAFAKAAEAAPGSQIAVRAQEHVQNLKSR